jgi:hypothetical protein
MKTINMLITAAVLLAGCQTPAGTNESGKNAIFLEYEGFSFGYRQPKPKPQATPKVEPKPSPASTPIGNG